MVVTVCGAVIAAGLPQRAERDREPAGLRREVTPETQHVHPPQQPRVLRQLRKLFGGQHHRRDMRPQPGPFRHRRRADRRIQAEVLRRLRRVLRDVRRHHPRRHRTLHIAEIGVMDQVVELLRRVPAQGSDVDLLPEPQPGRATSRSAEPPPSHPRPLPGPRR